MPAGASSWSAAAATGRSGGRRRCRGRWWHGVGVGAAAELEADSQGVDKTLVYRCIVEEDAGLDLVEKLVVEVPDILKTGGVCHFSSEGRELGVQHVCHQVVLEVVHQGHVLPGLGKSVQYIPGLVPLPPGHPALEHGLGPELTKSCLSPPDQQEEAKVEIVFLQSCGGDYEVQGPGYSILQ